MKNVLFSPTRCEYFAVRYVIVFFVIVLLMNGMPLGYSWKTEIDSQGSLLSSNNWPSVAIYAFTGGVLKTQTQYMLKDTRIGTPMDIPVTYFVIKHDDDWIAFDTGNNQRVIDTPLDYWGKEICDAYYPVMEREDFFENKLQLLGLAPSDLRAVIISHGHLDHAGAIGSFRNLNVPIYIQQKEIALISKARQEQIRTAYIPDDFQYWDDLMIKPIDGVVDIFGDGSIIAYPTPGHTLGHQSLIVRDSPNASPIVLTSDAMYTLENMEKTIPPGLSMDTNLSLHSLQTFQLLSRLNISVIPSHDPLFWSHVDLAPKVFAW